MPTEWQTLSGEARSYASSAGFIASKGWFEKLEKCASLHNVKLVGAASADHKVAQACPELLKQLIEEKGYKPE